MTSERKLEELKKLNNLIQENADICRLAFANNEALKDICIRANYQIFETKMRTILES